MQQAQPQRHLARPARLAEPVVADLVGRIVSGQIEPGTLLPAEPELVAAYGISRGTLREAVKALEAKGMVRAQQGRGTGVLDRAHWQILDPIVLSACLEHDKSRRIFRDLTSVRIAIESELARDAALNASMEQLQEMNALLDVMKQTHRGPDRYLELDVAFHDLIAEASGNSIAQAIMSSIKEPLRSMRHISNRIPHGITMATQFHLRIYECISASDSDAASMAMTEHLIWARDHLGSTLEPVRQPGPPGSTPCLSSAT